MKHPPRCSMCKKPAHVDYRPFCSKRCADIDLARWLRGEYYIPSEDKEPDNGEEDEE